MAKEKTDIKETDNVELSAELSKRYDEVFSETGKKKQDEAYLPPDEDTEEDIKGATFKEIEDKVIKEEEAEEVEKETEEKTKEEEYEDIPERLILAGRSAGFSDEKIVKLAENEPEVLEALANYRDQLIEKPRQEIQAPQVIQKKEPERLKPVQIDLTGVEDDNTRKLVETLIAGQNQLIDRYNKTSEELDNIRTRGETLEQQTQADFNVFVDGVLDEEFKNCPALGESRSLTTDAKKARSEIFDIALVLNQSRNKPIEQALRDAVKAYNGLYSNDTKAEDSLRQKLNAQKKRFTARPGGKKTERQYKDADEKAMEAMVEKGREIGFDW